MRLKDEFDEVEQAVARPVEVLDDKDQRLARRRQLDGVTPGREDGRLVGDVGFRRPDRRCQQLSAVLRRIVPESLEPLLDRSPKALGWQVVAEVGESLEEAPQRPVGQPLAVGQALSDGHSCLPGDPVAPVEELLQKSCLARARRREQRDQERPTLADRALGDQSQLGEIAVPTDKRQPLSQVALQPPEDDGRMDLKRLAARLLAYQRTELETAPRRPDRSPNW